MAKQKTQAEKQTTKSFPKTEANRKRRLERHMKQHPKDEQTAKAAAKKKALRHKPFGTKQVKAQSHQFTGYELFPRGNMSPAEYTKEVANMRKPLAELLKQTQGQFGNVKPNIFGVEYTKDNTRALCYGLGIKFTGEARSKPSGKRSYKRK